MHFALAFPWQCFCWGLQDFVLRASTFTLVTAAKTSRIVVTNFKKLLLCKFCCTNVVICNAMCSFLTSKIVLKTLLDALFQFKSKDKYERKMLNRLKRSFKRKIYINSFCLTSQVSFFFSANRWTNGKRMKQNKSCLKGYTMWKQSLFHCHVNEGRGWINCQKYIIDLTSSSTYIQALLWPVQVISLVCKQ